MKSLSKYVVCCALLLCFVPSALWADLLVLTSGKRISGFFIREADELITFRTMEGEELTVAKSEVQKLALGYTGSPVCVTGKSAKAGTDKRNCNALLYKASKGKLLIAEGEGFLRLREVPAEKVERVEFREANAKTAHLASSLPKGMDLEIRTKTGPIRGHVEKGGDKIWVIRDTRGKLHTVEKEDIAAVVLNPNAKEESVFDRDIRWWHIFPGLYQYQQNDTIKGMALGGGFSAALVGVLVEYQASLEAARGGSSDPTVLFFYNDSYKKSFEAHQGREKAFGIAAALIYVYHAVDYFYLGGYPKKNAASSGKNSVRLFLESSYAERSRTGGMASFVFPEGPSASSPAMGLRSVPRRERIEMGFRFSF